MPSATSRRFEHRFNRRLHLPELVPRPACVALGTLPMPEKLLEPGVADACIVYIAFTISSTIFFASENSIMVLSRKNSSFSIPA